MRGILFFLHQMENLQVITTITNLEQIMGEIYVIFIVFCMNVGRKMLELKSEMCKWSSSSVIPVDLDSKNQHF
jgi:hypothetical protein